MGKTFFFRSWFIGMTRYMFKKYPPFYNTLNAAKRTEIIGISKKGKPIKRTFFTCNGCKIEYKNPEVIVDHIDPVIDPKVGFPLFPDGSDDWPTYLRRLYCPMENLQVLCKTCHDVKTYKETGKRVKTRKKKVLTK